MESTEPLLPPPAATTTINNTSEFAVAAAELSFSSSSSSSSSSTTSSSQSSDGSSSSSSSTSSSSTSSSDDDDDDDDDDDRSHASLLSGTAMEDELRNNHHHHNMHPSSTHSTVPSVQPYVAKMERFELFSTAQCYYLIASDKAGTIFRVLKLDRTLIEIPANANADSNNNNTNTNSSSSSSASQQQAGKQNGSFSPSNNNRMMNEISETFRHRQNGGSSSGGGTTTQDGKSSSGLPSSSTMEDDQNRQPTLRHLSEFCTEDPTVYSATEIRNMLDMIHDGNRSHGFVDGGGGKQNQQQQQQQQQHQQGKNGNGGLKPLVKAHGIVGFIRFLDCYLLTLITKKSKVGCIGGNDIYTIKNTETFPIKPAEGNSNGMDSGKDPHSVLLNMWNRGKRSLNLGLSTRELAELHYQGIYQVVDLEKDFFFSYTYDITRSLQQNVLTMASQSFPPPPFKDQYAWNYFQTRELEEITGSLSSFHWIMPIINGAFIQRKLHDYGKTLNLTLMARRSRHFAGTRYLKRGVSDRGKVANDVEHEQIIHDETPGADGVFSSFLQVRGSIPTYWTQESSVTMPKPPIVLNRVDPTYHATQLHFEDLIQRYGCPIIVADLVKQSEKREREVIIGNEFRHAIDYLNQNIDMEHKIRYCALDYSHITKHRNLNVSSSLHDVATWAVNQTGFFCSAPRWKIIEDGKVVPFNENESNDDRERRNHITYHLGVPVLPMEQKGVLRTNCIDCLDRTNVAQFSAGVESLGQQLVVMGIRNAPKLSSNSNIVKMLIDMYVEIGDQIALQYGGSEAHKKVHTSGINTEPHGGAIGKHKELLTSIRRYYSNAFTDQLRQAGMNLFLGHYIPSREKIPLWDMENDYYLHNFHVKSGKGSSQSMNHFAKTFAIVSGERSSSSLGKIQKNNQESLSITKLRQQLKVQNDALSVWWKVAIQSYIQQRMWMQLGRGPECLLPTRFERLYTPDKLSQFDKIFARTWQKPMRVSHSAQHFLKASEEEKESLLTHRKTVHSESLKGWDEKSHESDGSSDEEDQDHSTSLDNYVNKHGYSSFSEPYMSKFLSLGKLRSHNEESNYVGSHTQDKTPCEEYQNYLHPGHFKRYSKRYSVEKVNEFKACLSENNLASDNVEGILKLSQSAHISNEILSGPYSGLSQHESAVEVTTVIQEQFNAIENLKERGALPNSVLPGVNEELRRRSLDTVGVMDAVYGGWNRFSKTEECYKEIVDSSSLGQRRSDLTDSKSMKLYCSFFDGSTPLTNLEMNRISGGKEALNKTIPKNKSSRASEGRKEEQRHGGVQTGKVKRKMDLSIESDNTKAPPTLFPLEERTMIPRGYEQINEDLFARKDNRFMVFNGVGVEPSWPPKPNSKISSKSLVEDITITVNVEKR